MSWDNVIQIGDLRRQLKRAKTLKERIEIEDKIHALLYGKKASKKW